MASFLNNSDPAFLQKELNALIELTQRPADSPPSVGQTITIQGVRIDFPVKPYPAQIQMMTKIISALNKEENALLESPTGSGKSLALLCSVLAWKEQQTKIAMDKVISEKEAMLSELSQTIGTQEASDSQLALVKQFIECIAEEQQKEEHHSYHKAKQERTKPLAGKIYVASRTHKQITQLIRELRNKTRYRPRTAVMGSREHLCIHKKVQSSSNKTEDCRKLLDEKSCSFYKQTKKLLNGRPFAKEIWDIEDLVQEGKKVGGCPYYAARTLFESAEVIFCPYNYIIDPAIRKVMEINLKDSIIVLDEAHNIEDASRSAGSFELTENEIDVLIDELALVVKYSTLPSAHAILQLMIENLSTLTKGDIHYTSKGFMELSAHHTGDTMLKKLDDVGVNHETYYDSLLPAFRAADGHAEKVRQQREKIRIEIEEAPNTQNPDGGTKTMGVSCLSTGSLNYLQRLFLVLGFLFDPKHNYVDAYALVQIRKKTSTQSSSTTTRRRRRRRLNDEEPQSSWIQKIGFWCLDPSVIFRNMCDETRSVILTSGTLSPLNTFASELDTKFEGRLEANHVINPSQVWVSAIPYGPNHQILKGNYANFRSTEYQDEVGQAICRIVKTVPYGILCFMPSYEAIKTLLARWRATGVLKEIEKRKLVLKEPQSKRKADFDNILRRFYLTIENIEDDESDNHLDGIIMFAVFRGKVSEGIDFSDNYCRAVVTLGIPYPGIKDLEVILKKEYNDKAQHKNKGRDTLSGSEWYAAQAFRAINQALGRCIRHKDDWGAIILLEERFSNREYVNGLSKWVKGFFNINYQYEVSMESLSNFVYKQLDDKEREYLEERRSRVKVEPMSTSSEDENEEELVHKVRTKEYVSEEEVESENLKTIKIEDIKVEDEAIEKGNVEGHNNTNEKEHEDLFNNSSDENTKNDLFNEDTKEDNNKYSLAKDIEMSQYVLDDYDVDMESDGVSVSAHAENEFTSQNIPDNNVDTQKTHTNKLTAELPKLPSLSSLNLNSFKSNTTFDDLASFTPPSSFSKNENTELPTNEDSYSVLDINEPQATNECLLDPKLDTRMIQVHCRKCKKQLLQGPYLAITHGGPRLSLPCLLNDGPLMTVQHLDTWETSRQLVGSELDIRKLPRTSHVILDTQEEICYKTLSCHCDIGNVIGVLVCAATSDKNKDRVGKVYLLESEIAKKNDEDQPKQDMDGFLELAMADFEKAVAALPR